MPQTNPAEVTDYMSYTDEVEQIPQSNKLYIKMLKKYCEMKGAQFAIVSVPSYKNWNYKKHNGVKEFTDKEKIEFIDLNVDGHCTL